MEKSSFTFLLWRAVTDNEASEVEDELGFQMLLFPYSSSFSFCSCTTREEVNLLEFAFTFLLLDGDLSLVKLLEGIGIARVNGASPTKRNSLALLLCDSSIESSPFSAEARAFD